MLRLFVALNLLFLNLYSCEGGYDSCKRKVNDSSAIANQSATIPLKNNQRLVFSTNAPNAKILKYDPFLSLYLTEDKKSFKYPFVITNNTPLGLAGVNQKEALEGKILKRQVGLNNLATFSEPLSAPSLLLTSCCALEGIATPRGIIEKEYLERFLKIKKVSYSDIGVRVAEDKKLVVVNAINPFMDANEFKIGDRVLEFDGKKVNNASEFMRWVLFSEVGSRHKVKIKRDSKILTLSATSRQRNGGGYLSDTFLEVLGLSFDKNLKIIKIEPKAKKYELKIGDRLIQINQQNITTEGEILKIISQSVESANLLFERVDFQFFVKIKSI